MLELFNLLLWLVTENKYYIMFCIFQHLFYNFPTFIGESLYRVGTTCCSWVYTKTAQIARHLFYDSYNLFDKNRNKIIEDSNISKSQEI